MRPNPRPARRLYVVSRAARSRAKLKTSIFHQTNKISLTNLAVRSPALARSAPTMATGRGPRATTTLAEITPDTQVTATLDGFKLIQMD